MICEASPFQPISAQAASFNFGDRLDLSLVRAFGTILSTATLMWAFVQAPFLHVHLEESDRPPASLNHLHIPKSDSCTGPTIAAHSADDDAITIEWRIASPGAHPVIADLPVRRIAISEPPSVISFATDVPQPRAHDPPDLGPSQPRSPPA